MSTSSAASSASRRDVATTIRDRVADVAHDIVSQGGMRRRRGVRRTRSASARRARPQGRTPRTPRVRRAAARAAPSSMPSDAGERVRAPHEDGVEQAGRVEIGDELGNAGEKTPIFDASHARAGEPRRAHAVRRSRRRRSRRRRRGTATPSNRRGRRTAVSTCAPIRAAPGGSIRPSMRAPPSRSTSRDRVRHVTGHRAGEGAVRADERVDRAGARDFDVGPAGHAAVGTRPDATEAMAPALVAHLHHDRALPRARPRRARCRDP